MSFGSHTPEVHTRMPTSGEQVMTVVGVVGSGMPLSTLGMHVPRTAGSVLVHQSAGSQSLSAWQPATHRPVPVSHKLPV